MAEDSILDATKRQLNLDPEDSSYDQEIVLHINSIFFVLHQVGVGPKTVFSIEDRTSKWTEFIGEDVIGAVRTYMGLKVRLIFDPPQTGPLTEAIERLVEQLEFRLNVHAEGVKWEEAQQTYLSSTELA
jgi:hypothetical protein